MFGPKKSLKSTVSFICCLCRRKCHVDAQTKPSFMELVKKHRKMLNDREAMFNYLTSNVIFQNERIIAINKPMELPLSYHPPKSYQGAPIPLHEQPVNLEALLPRLREHFRASDLNVSVPLQRLYSGVMILGRTRKDCDWFKKKSEGLRKHRFMFQQMNLICIGTPKYLPSKPEDVFLKYEKINDVPQSVMVSSPSHNQRWYRKEVDMICCYPEVVSQHSEEKSDMKAWCHVKLFVTSSALDVCQNYMARKMSPVLGDQIYHKNINFVVGKTVPGNPRLNPYKEMPIDQTLLNRLKITKDEINLIPLMVHKSSINVHTYLQDPIEAPLPDYFKLALEKLSLSQTDNKDRDVLSLSSKRY